ncbi:MAG: alkaline phosphatase [Bacteroidales bacterium]
MKKNFQSLFSLIFLFVCLTASGSQAKYVFFFIGDGMGVNQVNGTEMYLQEMKEEIGVTSLAFTSFPYTGLVKTHSQSHPITDSAAGGTALATGVKTKNGTISMDHNHEQKLKTIAERAHEKGKNVGIATSVSVDHATPASFYAHQPTRKMTYDIGVDLTKSGFEFFAGSDFLSPEDKKNTSSPNLFTLIDKAGYTIARGLKEFKNKQAVSDKLILLQEKGKEKYSLPFAIDRRSDDLTLPQITESAIQFLTKDNKGFFLMVEGGKIDWSSHSNDVATTFREVIDMDQAVLKALDFYRANPDSTLIVVTADHETGGLALGRRGYEMNLKLLKKQNISQSELSREFNQWNTDHHGLMSWDAMKRFLKEKLGFWDSVMITEQEHDDLKKVYDEIYEQDSELVKSEYALDEEIVSLSVEILNKKGNIGWTTKGHSGAYVPVFAIGAGAELFHGLMDNTEVSKKIIDAAGY